MHKSIIDFVVTFLIFLQAVKLSKKKLITKTLVSIPNYNLTLQWLHIIVYSVAPEIIHKTHPHLYHLPIHDERALNKAC